MMKIVCRNCATQFARPESSAWMPIGSYIECWNCGTFVSSGTSYTEHPTVAWWFRRNVRTLPRAMLCGLGAGFVGMIAGLIWTTITILGSILLDGMNVPEALVRGCHTAICFSIPCALGALIGGTLLGFRYRGDPAEHQGRGWARFLGGILGIWGGLAHAAAEPDPWVPLTILEVVVGILICGYGAGEAVTFVQFSLPTKKSS